MAWTLYRSILKDLLKLLAVSTAVLVTVVSFAAAIRPLQEGLLGPALLLKFVFYSLPTMLAYVLPLTAAFSGVLVFLRLAQDNEVLACSAAGMSYRRILFPVAVLALILVLGMFYLGNFVVPAFYRGAEKTARRDLIAMLMTELSEGKPFRHENWVIFANAAEDLPVDELMALEQMAGAERPDRALGMEGLALVELDKGGIPRNDVTAEKAIILIYEDLSDAIGPRAAGDTWVVPIASNFIQLDAQGVPKWARSGSLPAQRFPARLSDDLDFFTLGQLRELDDMPEMYEPVRRFQLDLARAIAEARLRTYVREQTARGEVAIWTLPIGADTGLMPTGPMSSSDGGGTDEATSAGEMDAERFELSGPQARAVPGGQLIMAERQRPIRIVHRRMTDTLIYEADSAFISYSSQGRQLEPRARMELENARLIGRDGSVQNEFPTLAFTGLRHPEALLVEESDGAEAGNYGTGAGSPISINNLQRLAAQPDASGESVEKAARLLGTQLSDLNRRIGATIHQRIATSVSCGLVLLLAAISALRSGKQTPLVVYFWVFLMAIGSILLIYTGQNLIGGNKTNFEFGAAVLWSGNLIIGITVLLNFRILSRH